MFVGGDGENAEFVHSTDILETDGDEFLEYIGRYHEPAPSKRVRPGGTHTRAAGAGTVKDMFPPASVEGAAGVAGVAGVAGIADEDGKASSG